MAPYAGTFASIKDAVVKYARLDATADDTLVGDAVNLAYQQVVQETQCLEQTGTAVLTDSVATYALPAQVMQINQATITYQDGTTSTPLQRVPLDTILENRRLSLAQAEQLWLPLYALVGQNQLELWPTPGSGQSMTFRYVYLPDELVADGDMPLIFEPYGSKLLTYGALVEMSRFMKDPLLGDYEPAYQAWLVRHQVFLNRRNGASSLAFRARGGYQDQWWAALPRDVG